MECAEVVGQRAADLFYAPAQGKAGAHSLLALPADLRPLLPLLPTSPAEGSGPTLLWESRDSLQSGSAGGMREASRHHSDHQGSR